MKKLTKTSLFLALTFTVCFGLVALFKLLGFQYAGLAATILAVVYMLIPMSMVFLIERVIHKEEITQNLFLSLKLNGWFLVALLVPVVLAFATLGFNLLFPEVSYSPDLSGFLEKYKDMIPPAEFEEAQQEIASLPIPLIWITLISGLISGASINALFAFGEELGWRAFLVRQFKNLNFIKASLLIGFIWGIWHMPLILMGHNYPQNPQMGVLYMIVFCVLLTPLFNYVVIKSKSVIAASVMHGTINALAAIPIQYISGGSDLQVGITGLAGFMVLFIMIAALFIYDWFISKERLFAKPLGYNLDQTSVGEF